MNIETTKSELIETIQNEEVLNRMKSQAQRLKEIDKNISESNYSIEEAELIDKIKNGLSENVFVRQHKLGLKLLKEEITEEERQELIEITDKTETFSGERLNNMIDLAKIWNTTVKDVMKRLGIKPRKTLHA